MSSSKRKYEQIDSDNEELTPQAPLSEADIAQHEIALTTHKLTVAKHEIFILKHKSKLPDHQLAQHEIDLTAEKLSVANREIFILKHKNKLLDHQLCELKSDNQHPQPALPTTDQQFNQLLLDNDNLRSTVSELREQLLNKEVDAAVASQNVDQPDQTALHSTVNEMRDQLSNKEPVALMQQFSELKNIIEQLSSQLSDKESELLIKEDALSSKISEMQARESDLQERITSLKLQIYEQTRELGHRNAQLDNLCRELRQSDNNFSVQTAELSRQRQHETDVRQESCSSQLSNADEQPKPSESHASRSIIIKSDTSPTSISPKPVNQQISQSQSSTDRSRCAPRAGLIAVHSIQSRQASSALNQCEALYSSSQLLQVPHVQSLSNTFSSRAGVEIPDNDKQVMMTPELKQLMDKVHSKYPRFRFNTDCDTSPFKLREKVHVVTPKLWIAGVVLAIAHTDQVIEQLKQLQHDQFIRGIPVSVKSLPPDIKLSAHHKYCYVVGWADEQWKSLPPVFAVEPAIRQISVAPWMTALTPMADIVPVLLGSAFF